MPYLACSLVRTNLVEKFLGFFVVGEVVTYGLDEAIDGFGSCSFDVTRV